ncbi:DUF4238 domain-containing protein [Pseudoduganella sp. FT26W]|uniref:DUF4238 domain-containing protein n=1 Tax=Duganella aquatilis TaxID=2666082 RepID=A0A844D543_9BURK|nr:DUF4238 domain-containing protein [Duganella aquatilis]MRW83752.1 DUF4238 domain-containing protein [Duganella aquatilis]
MSTKTKKQHYVPQLLLQHFENNERVCVFDSTRNLFRQNIDVKNEFARNYFYDKSGKIDPLLNTGIETPAAPFISRYVEQLKTNGVNPPVEILRFITNQLMRTPSALRQALGAIEAYSSSVIKQIGELHGFPEEITKNIKLEPKDPKAILAYITATSIIQWPLIEDLGQRLLINNTQIPFIISDHPVVQYNKYLQNCKNPAKTSLPARGLIIFLPISPKVTLCLFDQEVYRFKNRTQPTTEISTKEDVDILNSLQAMNREDSIIFSHESDESYVRCLCHKFKPNSLHTIQSRKAPIVLLRNGKNAADHFIWRVQTNIPKWISIVTVRKKAKENQDIYSHRLPEAVARQKIIMENFEKKWQEEAEKEGLVPK